MIQTGHLGSASNLVIKNSINKNTFDKNSTCVSHHARRWLGSVGKKVLLALSVPVLLGGAAASQANAVIASWNLKHAGWNNGKHLEQVAAVASHMDLIGLQEVMKEEVVTELEHQLEALTGDEWDSLVSHAVGRSTYTERYAYLYRDKAISYQGGAAVYLDPQDVFSREPLLATFVEKETGRAFSAANVHIVYGDSKADRSPEIRALADIYDLMKEISPGTPTIIMGDFNMAPTEPAWGDLRTLGLRPLITEGATTLSKTDGRYASLYDNIWYVPSEWPKANGDVFRFPDYLGISHETARADVSDHAPIYLSVTGETLALLPLEGGQPQAAGTEVASRASSTSSSASQTCIDLNTANADQLDQLPNIGPARAADIIRQRPWSSSGQLTRISGIGQGTVSKIVASGLLCS
ncbi:endonuclease/exonuclease/phosphatase family protein [Cobetia sp. cqz5-12]|uniref:endonuclease/exonuclease/phosphatase family protein n=1 Tax=Cobetia sp. cqz5-12 TaxID=2609415 RepID=UPI001F1584CF|nr:endonuclease/exonuclease/phosphatase family protein [Cobetia sp. cqz5-12]